MMKKREGLSWNSFSQRVLGKSCKPSTLFTAKFSAKNVYKQINRFGLSCLMPLSTIFQLYRGGQL